MNLEGVFVEDQKKDTLLAAGTVQVRITDWFFLKEKAVLEYIGLKDAVVYFNRKDSVWNYHFLEAYFASKDTAKKNAGIELELKKVWMDNVRFVQKDAWLGNDITASIGKLDLDADQISFSKQIVNIRKLDLQNPSFIAYSYQGRKPVTKQQAAITSNEESWQFLLQNLAITNGNFKSDNQSNGPKQGVFDGEHMHFTGITGTFRNIGLVKDTVSGFVDFKAKERSGLVIQRLKANTTIHSSAMVFKDLFLQTNRSVLTDYFAMRFPNGMANFEKEVLMEANFNKASIASDDIAFFAPDAKSWNRVIRLNGRVKGTVDDLSAQQLEVWAGNKTYINGNLSIVGLPDFNAAFINLEAKELRTTYDDAVSFIPSLRKVKSPNLRALQFLRFKGTYTGFVNDFVTYGSLQTALGTLTTDINMKLPKGGEPVYSGRLSTGGFNLGRLLNNDQLGIVDFHGTVKGRSFDWEKINVDINGSIHRFDYGGYNYQNITAKGNLSNKRFNGNFIIKDPNVDFSLNGLIDFRGNLPLFSGRANIAKVNLKSLGITKEDVILEGLFDVNLRGSNLSNVFGNARIDNVTITHNGKKLSLDSLIVFSGEVDGLKTLRVSSSEFDASVRGNFDLKSLPESFTFFLSRYYPAYIEAPRYVVPQTFTFDITTGVVEDYIKLLDTSFSGFNNSHITGALNTTANTMTVDADVPLFSYRQYQFADVKLRGSGDYEKLLLTGEVNNAVISETVNFPFTTFTIEAKNDVSDVTINTTSNQTINKANLAAQIKTFEDGVSIEFASSSFVLNNKLWSIQQGGELNFRRNTVVQGQLILQESNQQVEIATQPSDIGNWNDLHITLRNINLGDISPFVVPGNRLEGMLQGDILVEDPQNKMNVKATLRTDELRLDNDSIGQIQATMAYNNRTGMLTGDGRNMDPEHRIDFDLALDFKDSANTHQDRISLHPRNFQLKYLERFLGTLFTDINGYLTGDINILGEGKDREYLAKAKLKDAGFTVAFTKVPYRIEDTQIELTKNEIKLNGIVLRDKNNNPITVKGNITHKAFADMYYDIVVETKSPRTQLLKTGANDNPLFYGEAYGAGEFVLVGPQRNLEIFINIEASRVDTSTITLPPSNERTSGQAGFMVEKKYGREMNPTVLSGSNNNMKYNVTMTVHPTVKMEVILDELTGDIIRGKGNGTLSISSGTTSPLTINGRYDIDEGNYLFTFQSLLKKPFIIREGSNSYIEWTGDPYKAKVYLEAIYTAENVSFAPLGTLLKGTSQSGVDVSRLRENVNVLATLTGELFQPKFDFQLQLPPTSVAYRDPGISFGIQQLERNPNELTKQVSYLILFNSFAPYQSFAQSGNNPFNEAISNTISGILFGEANRLINQALSNVLQRNNLTLNLSGSLYNRNLIQFSDRGLRIPNQWDLNLSLGWTVGRVIFTIGGTFDVPLQNNITQTVQLFPDVAIEFLLNKSGSVRAIAFYRENIDFLTSSGTSSGNLQTRRYGTSLSYGKEFDSFKELVTGKKSDGRGKRKQKKDTTAINVIDSTLNVQRKPAGQ